MTKENSSVKKYDDMILGKNVISTFNSQVTGLNVNTDNLVHTARRFSARFPVIECIHSAT